MLAPLFTAATCLGSVMESCADSNAGEREPPMSQGDAAKRDQPSDLMDSAEAEVHGGGKCTQQVHGGVPPLVPFPFEATTVLSPGLSFLTRQSPTLIQFIGVFFTH